MRATAVGGEMPKRSNLFQDVVVAVHERLSPGAEIQSSALLPHRSTGEMREVDVVVRGAIAGQPVLVAIEATASSRRATLPWVEQLVQKHAELPTSKLVLVAQGGFTKPAIDMAVAHNVAVISPQEIDGQDPANAIANHLGSLYSKALSLTATGATVTAFDPVRAGPAILTDPPLELDLVDEDGDLVCVLGDAVRGMIQAHVKSHSRSEEIRDQEEDGSGTFSVHVAPLSAQRDGKDVPLFLRWIDSAGNAVLHPIIRLGVSGTAIVEVRRIDLTHRQFGDVKATYGEFDTLGQPVTLVATEYGGTETFHVRVREGAGESRALEVERFTSTPSDRDQVDG
jgi:hypothetical protein